MTTSWDPSAFLRDGRLIRLPAKWNRRLVVLERLAAEAFDRDVRYDEKTVNEILRRYTEGGVIDHVSIRRYLVETRFLARDTATGHYWVP
ncbi:hypothetical protein GCM10027589_58060 [Actinocorallia lasiicapitis]